MGLLGGPSTLRLRHWSSTASQQRVASLLRSRKRVRRPCLCCSHRYESIHHDVRVRCVGRLVVSSFSSSRSYATVTREDVKCFRSILDSNEEKGDEHWRGDNDSTAPSRLRPTSKKARVLFRDDDDENGDLLEPYNRDVTSHYRGSARVVLLPTSTLQVSELLRYCHERRLPVVPQGGNTGLVGGGVGTGVVLSTQFMDNVISFDEEEGVLSCQAGCVLQILQERAVASNWLVPLDLGAKGSCHIGGNVATNAGGVYYYRYGSLASNILGMEVVLPENGHVLHLGSSMRKDNTGYKLQNLLLGSEGTLGVVTGVTLQCHPLPPSRQAAWLVCPDFANVLRVRRAARYALGEILAAMEWMDANIVSVVSERLLLASSSARSLDFLSEAGGPRESRGGHQNRRHHHLLIETHGSHPDHDDEKMTNFLERVLEGGHAVHGVLAQSSQQQEAFWNVRESCNPAMAALGYTHKYDVSLPVQRFEEFLNDVRERLRSFEGGGRDVRVASWGHILDGNVHLNVHRTNDREKDVALASFLDELVFDLVSGMGGSISAEHGIGVAKKAFLPRVHDAAALRTMKGVKQLFDPHGILNPGKLF